MPAESGVQTLTSWPTSPRGDDPGRVGSGQSGRMTHHLHLVPVARWALPSRRSGAQARWRHETVVGLGILFGTALLVVVIASLSVLMLQASLR